jgi:hypothetical protein
MRKADRRRARRVVKFLERWLERCRMEAIFADDAESEPFWSGGDIEQAPAGNSLRFAGIEAGWRDVHSLTTAEKAAVIASCLGRPDRLPHDRRGGKEIARWFDRLTSELAALPDAGEFDTLRELVLYLRPMPSQGQLVGCGVRVGALDCSDLCGTPS